MDRAIMTAAKLVAPGGAFLIALYRKTPYCGIWRSIKKYYSRSSASTQRRIMRFYLFLKHLYPRIRNFDRWLRGKPTHDIKKHIASYGEHRGMDYYNDVHDWLGGYPYESIAAVDCINRFSKMGFDLGYSNIYKVHKLRGIFGSGCDEFGFYRVA
jgi:2-polyprenyl-6-hydroxyphenyl methylase/3-demethylubiquinone-9 3-methyltransferase